MLLITGASGFLGGHIVSECIDLEPLTPSHKELDLLNSPCQSLLSTIIPSRYMCKWGVFFL